MAGRVSMIVFDKTGTLTEDGLTIHGFMNVLKLVQNLTIMGEFYTECSGFKPDDKYFNDKEFLNENKMDLNYNLFTSLATCHSITYVDDNLIGDPLDI